MADKYAKQSQVTGNFMGQRRIYRDSIINNNITIFALSRVHDLDIGGKVKCTILGCPLACMYMSHSSLLKKCPKLLVPERLTLVALAKGKSAGVVRLARGPAEPHQHDKEMVSGWRQGVVAKVV